MNNATENKPVAIIGYSGHGFVAADILLSSGRKVSAYCDAEEKLIDPFSLQYLGSENDPTVVELLKQYDHFISVGDNSVRAAIYQKLFSRLGKPVNAIHPSAIISSSAKLGTGIFIAAGVIINPLVRIGDGAICNTGCSIDHECVIGNFSHIAPGAVLCGNVKVGEKTLIGAGTVVRQGITIGNNVIVGAGTVIVKDVPDNVTIIGNPQKEIENKIKS